MKRYFLLIFLVFSGLNVVYKSYIYFNSNKVSGKVVGLVRYNNEYTSQSRYSTKPNVSKEVSKSPLVAYSYKSNGWETSRNKWGYINLLEMNEKVTVLIDKKDENRININTLFQFWFTFHDMMTALCICIFGTAFLESVFPSKGKKPKTWK